MNESRPSLRTANREHQAAGDAEIDTSLSCVNLAAVREDIASALKSHGEDFVIDVQLVATELAANACDHAEDPRRLVLRREVHPERGTELVIEASDATVDRTPVVGTSSIAPYRGRGMQLIESLCTDWGVRVDGEMKIVWARLPIPAVENGS